jgi:tRNA pseudouridine13 synthase
MQRFGTASIPTHSIGLALLKAEWQKAVNMILCKRPGEHPDVEAARDAWLVEQNLNKALALLPRRVVAERCILESYQKQHGETRNAMGALSTVCLLVWCSVSALTIIARSRGTSDLCTSMHTSLTFGTPSYRSAFACLAPISQLKETSCTDLVQPLQATMLSRLKSRSKMTTTKQNLPQRKVRWYLGRRTALIDSHVAPAASGKRGKKPWQAPAVKTLTAEDVDNYTIFDVIMPLPGRDVDYPGGVLGDRYKELIQADGLDPLNWARPQK